MDLLEELHEAILTGDFFTSPDLTRRGLADGFAPQTLIDDAMIPAMAEAGRLFEEEDYFVPELLSSGRAIQAALAILHPLLKAGTSEYLGKVLIGTVQGDLHDIGKGLVAVMMEGAGFEVIDLGTDVSPAAVVEAIQENQPDIVALSALLTTTMMAMPRTIDAIVAAGVRDDVKVLLGGAPMNEEMAKEFGGDGYADNANAAVRLALELVDAS